MGGRFDILRKVFTSPVFVAIAILGVIGYYFLFHWLITSSNSGLFDVTVPIYLVYALVLSSGALLAVSAYVAHAELKRLRADVEVGMLSFLTPAIGGAVASCGCQFSVFASILYFLGFGVVQTTNIVLSIYSFQVPLIVAFIALNLAFMYYSLGRGVRACAVPKRRRH